MADFRRKLAQKLLRRGEAGRAAETIGPAVATARELFEAEPHSAIRYLYLSAAEEDEALIRYAHARTADGYRELTARRQAAFQRLKGCHNRPDWETALRSMVANVTAVAALDESGRVADADGVLAQSLAAAELCALEPADVGAARTCAQLLALDGVRQWPRDRTAARGRFEQAVRTLEPFAAARPDSKAASDLA